MSQQCMRVFQLCNTISLSGQPIIGQVGIAITDPSVALPLNADAVVYYSNRQTFPRAF